MDPKQLGFQDPINFWPFFLNVKTGSWGNNKLWQLVMILVIAIGGPLYITVIGNGHWAAWVFTVFTVLSCLFWTYVQWRQVRERVMMDFIRRLISGAGWHAQNQDYTEGPCRWGEPTLGEEKGWIQTPWMAFKLYTPFSREHASIVNKAFEMGQKGWTASQR